MKTYAVDISPAVYDDLQAYISETLSNPQTARNILQDILAAIRSLAQFPSRGKPLRPLLPMEITPEIAYRFIPCRKYLVFYRITEENRVLVVRVLSKRQDRWHILFPEDEP